MDKSALPLIKNNILASLLFLSEESESFVSRLEPVELRHGHITIIDRAGLEAFACECHEPTE